MAIQMSTAATPAIKTSMFNRAESTPRVHGQLCLRFAARGDRNQTILVESEQQLPLRIVRAFQLDDGGALVHLHNLSGGVLGGDHLDVTVEVGPRAVAQVTSTGATRIYRSRKNTEPAEQRLQISIAEDGLVEYLPDQLIPFAGSCYRQETRIELGANAGVFWWETVAPGREASNEVFAYDLLQLKTWISALGRLLGELAEQFSRPSRIVWGVSALRAHGVVVRALSTSGREITERLPDFWRVAKLFLYDREAVLPRKVY